MKSLFKDYLTTIKESNRNVKITILLALFVAIVQNAYLTVFNLYLAAGGYSTSSIGKILFYSNIGASIFALPIGIIGDRFGHKKLISLSAFFISLNILLQATTTNSIFLSCLSFLYGISGLVIHVSIYPYLSVNTSTKDRVNVFSLIFIITNIGAIIGSFLSGKLGDVFHQSEFISLRLSLIALSSIGIIASTMSFKMKERNEIQETFVPLKNLKETLIVSIKFAVHSGLIGLGAGMVLPFFNLYFRQIFHLSVDYIGSLFSVSALFFLIFGFLGPRLSRKYGAFKGTLIYESLSIPFLVALASGPPLYLAIISFWMRGGLMNAGLPLLSSVQMEMIPEDKRGTFSAFLMFVDNLFRSIGTLLGGIIIARIGFNKNFLLMALLYTVSILFLFYSFRNKLKHARTAHVEIEELTVK
jgi:MFS family permease